MRAASRLVLVAAAAFLVFVGVGPHVAGYRVLTVLTGSMRPTASEGSLVVVRPVPLSAVRTGDVISYHSPVGDHSVVTHRVVAIEGEGTDSPTVVTKGDANDAPDPWRARLVGTTAWKVRAVVPHAGHVVRAFRSPVLRTATLRLAPLALAGLWLAMIWRPRRDGHGSPVPQV